MQPYVNLNAAVMWLFATAVARPLNGGLSSAVTHCYVEAASVRFGGGSIRLYTYFAVVNRAPFGVSELVFVVVLPILLRADVLSYRAIVSRGRSGWYFLCRRAFSAAAISSHVVLSHSRRGRHVLLVGAAGVQLCAIAKRAGLAAFWGIHGVSSLWATAECHFRLQLV
eukprot:1209956-Pyramimonas_sp.AAC.1